MKKLYFSFLLIFGGLSVCNAQLLTQANHAPVVGDMYQTIQIDSTGISPGASGPSAVWTFTTPTTRTISVINSYTTVASVPSGSLYPSASVAMTNNTTRAFLSSTATQLNFWGGNFTALSQSVDYYFSSPAKYAVYPMAYTNSATAAFTGSLQSGTNNGTISNGTSTVIADAAGTLNLPMRSFSNVMRVNTYIGFDFSVPAFLATGNVKEQSWDYYPTLSDYPSTKLFPLFRIITTTITVSTPTNIVQTSTLVLLNKDYQYVGIKESVKEIASLNIFPNPAKNNFTLSFVNENADPVSYELTNTLGQSIKKENLGNEKGLVNYNINITDIQAGIYFVKVNAGLKSSTKKLTIQ
ncbi:MAG TPA: T9SS type A sorting domain-containing protein [Bacteroidia bacterium]|jgi:hypothetical protein|nr:T9SS type A sorting domain-containing protein [Bacteroidia bacterium]